MLVCYFERSPIGGAHSIERVFESVRSALPEDVQSRVVRCPTPAHTRFWLLLGMWRACRGAGEINHITGDIHYVALGIYGARTVLTIHDLHRLDQLTGFRKAVFKWLYFTLPLSRCAVVTTISNHTKQRLLQMYPSISHKTCVIPDCLPIGMVPKARQFNAECPRILHVGTKASKNLDRLIAAIRGLKCELHIVGRLTEEQRMMLADASVGYTNSIDMSDAALVDAYVESDIVAFASLSEGFGMPIIEAQAMGRPVITSKLAPMDSVAGDGACLVNPLIVEEIREGILRIARDGNYRSSLIERGLWNVQRFTPESIAQQYASIYLALRDERRDMSNSAR